jgi:hypothetical protein
LFHGAPNVALLLLAACRSAEPAKMDTAPSDSATADTADTADTAGNVDSADTAAPPRSSRLPILDFGRDSVSSVYHYFDPDEAWRSLGVYSVLQEVALVRELGYRWYYLGFYVADCTHLSYKAEYYPHQRRVRGQWTAFADAKDPGAPIPAAVPDVLVKDRVDGPR